jgi:hypothetical protein
MKRFIKKTHHLSKTAGSFIKMTGDISLILNCWGKNIRARALVIRPRHFLSTPVVL